MQQMSYYTHELIRCWVVGGGGVKLISRHLENLWRHNESELDKVGHNN